jgi:tetratricopeptide (TPR) repeat protein
MIRIPIRSIALAGVAGALAACSQPSAPARTAIRPDAAALVAAIRAAAEGFDSSVEVVPLRDAAVESLLRQAHSDEAAQRPAAALAALDRALALAPRAPDLLQYRAELLIETGDLEGAAAAAERSYQLGPKVGALCARSLETLARVHAALHHEALAQQAQQQLSSCRVPLPARY